MVLCKPAVDTIMGAGLSVEVHCILSDRTTRGLLTEGSEVSLSLTNGLFFLVTHCMTPIRG